MLILSNVLEFAKQNMLIIMLSMAVLISMIWLMGFRQRLDINIPAVIMISILHVVVGVFSVKVFAIIEGFGDLSVVGNMSLFGGVFFMPIAYYMGACLNKRNISDVFDVFTICIISTLMCARTNCLVSGCCQGRMIPGTLGLRWPTRELEILFYLVLMIWLIPKIKAFKMKGTAYPLYMTAYGIFRFITECFRASDKTAGIWHVSHIWAFIATMVGLSVYMEIESKKKKERR